MRALILDHGSEFEARGNPRERQLEQQISKITQKIMVHISQNEANPETNGKLERFFRRIRET